MSLKSAETASERRTPGLLPGVWSIQSRLTILSTVSAGGILILSSVFLYWVLASTLTQESQRFLTDKMRVLQNIIREHPENRQALEEEVQFEVAAYQYIKYYIRVLDATGVPLLETPEMAAVLPAMVFPVPPGVHEEPENSRHWQASTGNSYYLLTASAKIGQAGTERRLLQLGVDVSRHEALLATYRHTLTLVLGVGILCAVGAASIVARRVMRPLAEITQAAQRMTATQLSARIGPVRWPKELRALATTFDAMLTRLEDSFTRLSQFSVDLAHELRTPLTNIMGAVEVALARHRTPGEYQRILGSSLEEHVKLSQMIDSLLFLARAEIPETRIAPTQLDARRELEALREFYEVMAEEQEIALRCQGQGLLHADPLLFRHAVSNLLANALQYTLRGGRVTLSVTSADDRSTVIEVRDTGVGIAPEHLPYIFDRFYRVDPARSHHSPGMGLGLAIVQSIMTLHGGTVSLQSVPQHGTTVTLRFPPPA